MFLKPEQQLERCKRIVRQRVDPHIHPSIAQLAVESFDIPGEPMPTDEFFAKLNRGDIDFKPFTLGNEWGTTWGTVWFRLTGTVPAGYPKGKPLELILDLGWYPHSCGGHIEGLVYRADGTAIKAVHPLNYWVPFMDAEGNAQVPVAEDGSFTLYLEAASNPLLLGVPPFIETELGDHATGKPDEPYVFKSADLTEFDARFENYSVDLDVVSSLMEFADKQSPRYWQLAKALQRSLNAYDERNPESVEAARAALAGRTGQAGQRLGHERQRHRPRAYRLRMAVAGARDPPQGGPYRIQRAGFDGRRPGLHVCDEFRPTVRMAGRGSSRPVRTNEAAHRRRPVHPGRRHVGGIRWHVARR